jgi:NodT family efflux transporter outer membrane factor (OMF) lipoprotein
MKGAEMDAAQTNPRMARVLIPLVRGIVLGIMASSLSGCALHKPPSQPTIVTQALPKATPLPPAWSASSVTANVTDDWVKSFKDDKLDAMVREAIANNLDLRQAAAQVEQARQSVIVVGSKLKPQIGVTIAGATTRSSNAASSDQYQSNMEYGMISWEADVWGRVRSQRAATQENYEAITLDYAFARQSLAATTAKSWYLAIETGRLLALAQQSVDIYTQVLALVKVRRAAGKVADLDVAEASYELNEAQNQLIATQGLYSQAQRSLEVLVGRYPSAELTVAEEYAPLPPPVAPGLPSSLLERRPDIVAAEHQVLSAFRAHEAARLALLPSFSFDLEGGRLSDRLLSVLGLNPWLMHSVVGMFVPIYEGGALQAQIRIATAQEDQAVAHFGGVALNAFNEVEVALTNERLLAEQLPYIKNALLDHTEAVRIAELQYRAGSLDLLSVLQLQEGQIQTQAELIKLANTQLANRVNLHLALGGGFDNSPATSAPAASGHPPIN